MACTNNFTKDKLKILKSNLDEKKNFKLIPKCGDVLKCKMEEYVLLNLIL